ncbi:hypothetical protein HanRHA438_Chr05g0245241 [Helianthus annuus]|nr:hypothetical protein HanRHA438_Chr05g0245241 [Helianthus annuus]
MNFLGFADKAYKREHSVVLRVNYLRYFSHTDKLILSHPFLGFMYILDLGFRSRLVI